MSDTDEVRWLVATSSRILARYGQGDFIWGHSSARDPEGRGVWIKAGGWGLDEITPARVHLVDRSGRIVDGEGAVQFEYPIHTEIMTARPDVGGVVHTHAPHAIALAAAGKELLPVSHAANYFVPPAVPRFTATADLIMTADLGRAVAECLGDASALFLVNHGIITVGPDLPTATFAALLLEQAAEQQLHAMAFGDARHWSDPAESLAKREHIYNPTAIGKAWDYLVRTTASPPAADGASSRISSPG
ncbi:class II aldolase/adducin family protein [Nocardia africana]|uniref:L-ribulose-5-phosphate 4-epimerase UlaF n=1 Tax=Nocardia africana TaxID=134964 RepID=A0A378WY75_9NOCA|nr:class II aldolase/adducin family protein [Nocardia africana]MCC3312964.1 class II aldolase/adducin family protein [Nocardia africana]SUA45697.1 L-ribulose-5-phosphate 4-epimerase UlaF [Nocardia africana]